MVNYCCVFGCKNSALSPNVRFHKFPKERKQRKKWEVILKMGKTPSRYAVVCSSHFSHEAYKIRSYCDPKPGEKHQSKFIRLRPLAVPTLNLPKRKFDRICAPVRRNRLDTRASITTCQVHDTTIDPQLQLEDNSEYPQSHMTSRRSDELNAAISLVQLSTPAGSSTFTNFTQTDNSSSEQEGIDVSSLIVTDEDCTTLLGIQKKALFLSLAKTIDEYFPRRNTLSSKERVTLTFIKLKLGISFSAIGVIFKIKRVRAARLFKETISQLREILQYAVPWLHKEQIRANLPQSFQEFPNTRIVLDCTEITIERPSCLLCRIRTYSCYKSNHTAKILLGVAPSGLIIFVSKVYGGKASDKQITAESGILDKCEVGDGIMVDKGFAISDMCLLKGLKLIQPTFLTKKQLTREESIFSTKVARSRIHVERAIGRIKMFSILQKKLPWKLLPFMHDIMYVCSAIVNLSTPIIAAERFSRNCETL